MLVAGRRPRLAEVEHAEAGLDQPVEQVADAVLRCGRNRVGAGRGCQGGGARPPGDLGVIRLVPQQRAQLPVGNRGKLGKQIAEAGRDQRLRRGAQGRQVCKDGDRTVSVHRDLGPVDHRRRADRGEAVHRGGGRQRDELRADAVADDARDVGDSPRSDADEDARDAIERQQHLEGRAGVRTDLVSLEHDSEHVPTLGAQLRLNARAECGEGVIVGDEGEVRKLTLPTEAHELGQGIGANVDRQMRLCHHDSLRVVFAWMWDGLPTRPAAGVRQFSTPACLRQRSDELSAGLRFRSSGSDLTANVSVHR